MAIFVVEYQYDSARTDDLDVVRPDHRTFVRGLVEEGVVLASGPWHDNAAPGALLIIVATDQSAAQRVLDNDPFHRAHLITHRTLRAWHPVNGPFADG